MAREYTTAELSASADPFLQGMLAERQRVLAILAAHQSHLGSVSARLVNVVMAGFDLEEQLKLPPEERASGFDFGDD